MANATPSRLGFINNTSDGSFAQNTALFLKVFAGEILTAFAEKNVMLPLTMVRTIESGKSAQFPATWKASASYHTPGNEIDGDNQILAAEKVINIDGLLLADAFIANIDEAMNHYDVRSIYGAEIANALARQLDKNLLQLACLAARASSTLTGGDGGSVLTNAGYDTTADTLAQGITDAAQALDDKSVPAEDRCVVLRPKHYNLLLQSKAIHRDYNDPSGSNGTFASGVVHMVAGVKIVKSIHVPNSVIAAVTGQNNTYSGTFTNTIGVVFHKSAVGTVKLMDMSTESAYDIRRQGTLFVAKYAMGSGILRPESTVELVKA